MKGGEGLNGYRSIRKLFRKWGVSEQQAHSYGSEERISGTIPYTTEIPADLLKRRTGGGSNDG